MVTKILASCALTVALFAVGGAAHYATQAQADCCAANADCCNPPQACCATGDCCATGLDCCGTGQGCCTK